MRRGHDPFRTTAGEGTGGTVESGGDGAPPLHEEPTGTSAFPGRNERRLSGPSELERAKTLYRFDGIGIGGRPWCVTVFGEPKCRFDSYLLLVLRGAITFSKRGVGAGVMSWVVA